MSNPVRYTAAKRRELAAARAEWLDQIDRRLAALPLDDYIALSIAGHSLDADGSIRHDVMIPDRTEEDRAATIAWCTARHAELTAKYPTPEETQ